MISFREKVYNAVKKIPHGCVVTYAHIAAKCDSPRACRAVGNALNKNRSKDVPCHRVIRADGTPGGYAWGAEKKIAILKKEGVKFSGNRVNTASFYQSAVVYKNIKQSR